MSKKRNKKAVPNSAIEKVTPVDSQKPRVSNGNGVIALSRQELHQEIHTGPIPHPDILAKYDHIVPGAADRIIKMAENQQTHRQGLENKVISSDIDAMKRGQLFGFILTFVLIVVGSTFLALGKDVGALASYISAAAFLISSFVGVFFKKRKDIAKKE